MIFSFHFFVDKVEPNYKLCFQLKLIQMLIEIITASVHKQKQMEAGHSCQLVLCTLCSCELSICKKPWVKMRKGKCLVASVNSKTEFRNNCLGRYSRPNYCCSDPLFWFGLDKCPEKRLSRHPWRYLKDL